MPINRRYYNDPAYPTSVSRDVPAGEYSWCDVVYQSGRPVLDSELNLTAGAAEYANLLIAGKTLPSGFIRGQSSRDSGLDFMFPGPVIGLENQFALPKLTAFVAGMPVVVEYTNTITPGINLITLPVPTPTPGGSDIKRTDFVFLEVWRTLVAPSPRAMGSVEIVQPGITDGDTVSFVSMVIPFPLITFTAKLAPAAPTDFQIGASDVATASALAAAINASALYPTYVAANTNGTNVVTLSATFGGTLGNSILTGASAPANTVISPMAGGANRLNKPSQSTVYCHGNVLSPSGVDLQDELVDPVLNIESAQRVQVQYRIRVFSEDPVTGINPKTQPDGFSNPGVLAQGAKGFPVATYRFVPADNTTVIAPSDATSYGFVDNGLFVAGDGSQAAATALGTVDGFVYAIPVCFVFRRSDSSSTSGFNPGLSANSGLPLVHALPIMNPFLSGNPVFASGISDRPDGLFADIIAPTDVLDLRRHVTPPGYDFGSELKYQLQSLLDKKTATWQLDGSDFGEIGNGSGDQSTYPMFCDEVGRTDTPSGNLIRGFDHVARRLGAQNVVEKVVFEIYPDPALNPPGLVVTKATPGDVTWCEGDTVTVDFGALDPNSLQNWIGGAGLTNVGAVWPAGTKVTDVLSVFHDDGNSNVFTPIDQQVQLTTVAGIGTEVLELTLDANSSMVDAPPVFGPPVPPHLVVADPAVDDGSVRRIFVELEITYPTGAGLTGTPDITVTPDAAAAFYPPYAAGPILEADNTQRPADMDATWVPNPKFRSGYREVKLEQRTTLQTDYIVSRDSFSVVAPRRFFWGSMTANGAAPDPTTTYGSSDRLVILDAGVPAAGQSAVQVDYKTQDPVPDAGAIGYQLYVYYRSNAPQTAGTSGLVPTTLLPATLTVDPMSISAEVWTGQTGKGSTDLGFPYESALDQIATTPFPGGPFPGMQPKEWYFSALAEVSVADFSASTGILSLHSFVQVDGTNPIQLGGPGRGPLKDAELRAYYDMANPGGYKPTTMAQPLFGPTRHKVFQPMLVRSTVDTLLFRKGELLLMILSRFAELDPDNKIAFTDNPSIRTAAALYRTRNLLLTVGD